MAQKTPSRIWLVITVVALPPLVAFLIFGIRWYRQDTDLRRVFSHFLERQNAVLAHDAEGVATEIGGLLSQMAIDLKLLPLLGTREADLRSFLDLKSAEALEFSSLPEDPPQVKNVPLYSWLLIANTQGKFLSVLREGHLEPRLRTVADCSPTNLCDRALLEQVLSLPGDVLVYGNLLRYYIPKSEKNSGAGAALHAALKLRDRVYILGLNYTHLTKYLAAMVFPYVQKRDLLQAYQNGNYLYIVDGQYNIIAHPKYWHVAGVEKESGLAVTPVRTDADEGTHPLNVAAYREGALKEYFERLLKSSFTRPGADIFEAPNLAGTKRVLTVVPIPLKEGQFAATGVFGHLIVGCGVEYFEQPTEHWLPYY